MKVKNLFFIPRVKINDWKVLSRAMHCQNYILNCSSGYRVKDRVFESLGGN